MKTLLSKLGLFGLGLAIAMIATTHAFAADPAAAAANTAVVPPGLLDALFGWVFAHLGSLVHNLNAKLNTKSPQAADIAKIAEDAALKALTTALTAQAKT